MNQYVCFLRARATFLDDRTPEEAAIIGRHFAYLTDLARRGVVMLAGRTMVAPPLGIVLLHGESQETARAVMEADPAVAAGVFTMELRAFRVALAEMERVG